MKLTPIQQIEPTVKQSFAFKQSTYDQILAYQRMYKAQTGVAVSLKDLVEQMLLDFMREDKAFQKHLKATEVSAKAKVAASAKGSDTPATPSKAEKEDAVVAQDKVEPPAAVEKEAVTASTDVEAPAATVATESAKPVTPSQSTGNPYATSSQGLNAEPAKPAQSGYQGFRSFS